MMTKEDKLPIEATSDLSDRLSRFREVERPWGSVLVRDDDLVFIIHYEEILGHHAEFYTVYKSTDPKPKNRWPWTVDNKSVFKTRSKEDAILYGLTA